MLGSLDGHATTDEVRPYLLEFGQFLANQIFNDFRFFDISVRHLQTADGYSLSFEKKVEYEM